MIKSMFMLLLLFLWLELTPEKFYEVIFIILFFWIIGSITLEYTLNYFLN